MYEVTMQGSEELSEDELEEMPDNGSGKEYAGYIRITYDGKTLAIHSDAMEPEDATFGRDLSWIDEALREAYELGKKDG